MSVFYILSNTKPMVRSHGKRDFKGFSGVRTTEPIVSNKVTNFIIFAHGGFAKNYMRFLIVIKKQIIIVSAEKKKLYRQNLCSWPYHKYE